MDGRVRESIVGSRRPAWHPLNSAMYVWTKGHLVNIFLACLGDRTEMAHSLEARTPFLDHVLTEYVNGLPPSLKIRWVPGIGDEKGKFVEKWILREAAKPFITEELYNRTKHVSWISQSPRICSSSLFKSPFQFTSPNRQRLDAHLAHISMNT